MNYKERNLMNKDNYLTYDISTLTKKDIENFKYNFDKIIISYLNIFMKQVDSSTYNVNYLKYIITKGIETFAHIIKFLFLYTKNSSISFFYLEKSIYYYIEFIEQMVQDKNSFLKLNTKDAILFLYKKTIFEINQDKKEKFKMIDQDKKIYDKIGDGICKITTYYVEKIQNIESTSRDNFKEEFKTIIKGIKHQK